jgi:hypothetical protein
MSYHEEALHKLKHENLRGTDAEVIERVKEISKRGDKVGD